MTEAGERVTIVTRREKIFDKECAFCGTPFQGLARRKYCSQLCGVKASYRRHAEERRAERRARYRKQHAAAGQAPHAPAETVKVCGPNVRPPSRQIRGTTRMRG